LVEPSIKRRLARDLGVPSDDAIPPAWNDRLHPRLEAGFAIDEILEAPGLTRADIAALRSNYPAYIAAKVGPDAARATSTREEIEHAKRRIDAAELGLLGEDVREAMVDARRRDGAERAMRRANEYDRQRRASRTPLPLDAKTELELGFAIASDMGVPAHVPGARSHESILDEIDPGWRATAARATLSVETRQSMDDQARDAGPRRP
jgi:hypothetical protein